MVLLSLGTFAVWQMWHPPQSMDMMDPAQNLVCQIVAGCCYCAYGYVFFSFPQQKYKDMRVGWGD